MVVNSWLHVTQEMQGNAECNREVGGHSVFKKALGPHSVAIPPLLGFPRIPHGLG